MLAMVKSSATIDLQPEVPNLMVVAMMHSPQKLLVRPAKWSGVSPLRLEAVFRRHVHTALPGWSRQVWITYQSKMQD
jgi:hypothetical protein